ncbi:sensor histidine kinase [Streptomyces sp. NPDC090301]|uniref:sensor histidine kinase n=1 Tax=Streptomyces sp. NPDC090301 TaxID=3154975 RepID=UPI0034472586
MTTTALSSLWAEPRATDAPERVSRDWVLVGALMVAALLEGVLRDDVAWRPFATIVAVGLAPVVLWRRTHPLACVLVAFGTVMALGLASLLGGAPSVGLDTMIYILVLVYALVRWGSGREIVIGLAVVAVAAAIGTVADYTGPADLIGGFAILAAAAGGAAFRYRAESWRRALDQSRGEERVKLARELHDMVAHHVSAIAVQAQAGRATAGQRPEAALEALAVIEGEASRTLAEMRAMVRVLRDGAPAEYAPQPGVADLGSLARRAPVPVVDVELPDDLAGLPPQVDAAVYRLAQEALTNALRHARNASRVEIQVVVEGAGRLRLRVTDDGQTDPGRSVNHGFGLVGMTERVQLLGGTLRAGPAPEGGWTVDAELPTEARR